jgi:hypothetical protein
VPLISVLAEDRWEAISIRDRAIVASNAGIPTNGRQNGTMLWLLARTGLKTRAFEHPCPHQAVETGTISDSENYCLGGQNFKFT